MTQRHTQNITVLLVQNSTKSTQGIRVFSISHTTIKINYTII